MRGDAYPGWRGEGHCHRCNCYTSVTVTEAGVQYAVRTAKTTTCR